MIEKIIERNAFFCTFHRLLDTDSEIADSLTDSPTGAALTRLNVLVAVRRVVL